MDPLQIATLLRDGGAYGLTALALWLWWVERKERAKAADSLLQLTIASIEASSKTEAAIAAFSKTLEKIRDKLA